MPLPLLKRHHAGPQEVPAGLADLVTRRIPERPAPPPAPLPIPPTQHAPVASEPQPAVQAPPSEGHLAADSGAEPAPRRRTQAARARLDRDEKIEAECLRLMGSNLRRMLIANSANTFVAVAALVSHASLAALAIWLGTTISSSIIVGFIADTPLPLDIPRAVRTRRHELMTAFGSVATSWTVGAALTFESVDTEYRPILILAWCGALGAMSLGASLARSTYLAMLIPSSIVVVGRLALGSPSERHLAFIAAAVALSFAAHGLASNRNAVMLVRNRVENELLARKLHRANEIRQLLEEEVSDLEQSGMKAGQVDRTTGADTRKVFLSVLGDMWQQADDGGDPFSIAFVTVDRFSAISEQGGAAVGEELLRQIAQHLRSGLRTDDHLARVSHTQFGLVLANAMGNGAVICLDRIRRHISSIPLDVGEPLIVTISVGIVAWERGCTIGQLMSRADNSLRRSEDAGGNRLTLWGPELRDQDSAALG